MNLIIHLVFCFLLTFIKPSEISNYSEKSIYLSDFPLIVPEENDLLWFERFSHEEMISESFWITVVDACHAGVDLKSCGNYAEMAANMLIETGLLPNLYDYRSQNNELKQNVPDLVKVFSERLERIVSLLLKNEKYETFVKLIEAEGSINHQRLFLVDDEIDFIKLLSTFENDRKRGRFIINECSCGSAIIKDLLIFVMDNMPQYLFQLYAVLQTRGIQFNDEVFEVLIHPRVSNEVDAKVDKEVDNEVVIFKNALLKNNFKTNADKSTIFQHIIDYIHGRISSEKLYSVTLSIVKEIQSFRTELIDRDNCEDENKNELLVWVLKAAAKKKDFDLFKSLIQSYHQYYMRDLIENVLVDLNLDADLISTLFKSGLKGDLDLICANELNSCRHPISRYKLNILAANLQGSIGNFGGFFFYPGVFEKNPDILLVVIKSGNFNLATHRIVRTVAMVHYYDPATLVKFVVTLLETYGPGIFEIDQAACLWELVSFDGFVQLYKNETVKKFLPPKFKQLFWTLEDIFKVCSDSQLADLLVPLRDQFKSAHFVFEEDFVNLPLKCFKPEQAQNFIKVFHFPNLSDKAPFVDYETFLRSHKFFIDYYKNDFKFAIDHVPGHLLADILEENYTEVETLIFNEFFLNFKPKYNPSRLAKPTKLNDKMSFLFTSFKGLNFESLQENSRFDAPFKTIFDCNSILRELKRLDPQDLEIIRGKVIRFPKVYKQIIRSCDSETVTELNSLLNIQVQTNFCCVIN